MNKEGGGQRKIMNKEGYLRLLSSAEFSDYFSNAMVDNKQINLQLHNIYIYILNTYVRKLP